MSHRAIEPVPILPGRRERETLRPLLRRGPRRQSPSSSDRRARPTSCPEGPNHPRLVRRSSSGRRDAIPGDGRRPRALRCTSQRPPRPGRRAVARVARPPEPPERTVSWWRRAVPARRHDRALQRQPRSRRRRARRHRLPPGWRAQANQDPPSLPKGPTPAPHSPPRRGRGPGCTPSRERNERSREAPPGRSRIRAPPPTPSCPSGPPPGGRNRRRVYPTTVSIPGASVPPHRLLGPSPSGSPAERRSLGLAKPGGRALLLPSRSTRRAVLPRACRPDDRTQPP